MGFDEGRIILDSDNGTYYSGQTVYGRMVFDQDKVKTIHGIYVDIKGFCKVHWTTRHSRRVNGRTQHYTVHHDSHEEYFRGKTFLIGNESGEHHLPAGHHDLKFECSIPPGSPSSFEGAYGHVRYRVKVIMVTSGMFSFNKDKMVAIRVIVPVDLNADPYCKDPLEYELLSSYCCWCISAGSSELLVRMPKGGYCPGQIITLEVSCKNSSSVKIKEVKLAIKKDVTFRAVSAPGTRNDHDTIAEIKKGPVPPGATRNWIVEMEVPAMDVYNLNACSYINIMYFFKVSTEVGCCHKGNEENQPIVFGTIPLVGFQDDVENPLHDQMPKIQNVQGTNSYPPPPFTDQPLPNSPYPHGNAYPNTYPYPAGNPGYPTPILDGNSPYPSGNQPYPNVTPYPPNQPYPSGNSSYPAGNSPYPPPYPAGNSPYPTNTPYSTEKSPRGTDPSPVPPYPGARQSPVPPYQSVTGSTQLKTGNIGFLASSGGDPASVPLLPPGANVPYPTSPPSNPYATASAPEPSTPGCDEKKAELDNNPEPTLDNPSYNPDFMKNEKKDQNS